MAEVGVLAVEADLELPVSSCEGCDVEREDGRNGGSEDVVAWLTVPPSIVYGGWTCSDTAWLRTTDPISARRDRGEARGVDPRGDPRYSFTRRTPGQQDALPARDYSENSRYTSVSYKPGRERPAYRSNPKRKPVCF